MPPIQPTISKPDFKSSNVILNNPALTFHFKIQLQNRIAARGTSNTGMGTFEEIKEKDVSGLNQTKIVMVKARQQRLTLPTWKSKGLNSTLMLSTLPVFL